MSLAMDCDGSLADDKFQPLPPAMARVEFFPLQYYDKYVARTMRCLPDKFTELCHMHLAFLLDLSGDKLELLLSGHDEHKKKKSGLPSVGIFKKKDKSRGLFGLPLTDEGVCLVMPLIKFLKMEKNVTKEGLFRKPGNKMRMTKLKELLIAHGPMVNIDPEIFSANDVACVLKEFLRELPEPLLTERHLEAHRQILALGQHTKTPEEITRYSSRKLSALQLLMLLLPSPAQKLTMNLVQLLQRVADSPESKMTSATLGTIFAPIFFIERKVQPRDLYCQITTTAPAMGFMIEKAHELFKPPVELVRDLANFWNSMGQASLYPDKRSSSQMQKSLSGQTLYTNVCYADRELSQCVDVTSNTQAELASLLAHVQTLPNSPHCVKLKKQILKSADTPEFCSGLRRRSRSIGASIKKRLPALGRLMNRHAEVPTSSASSGSDSKTAASARTRLFECPSHTIETRRSLRIPRPGHKRHYFSENCPATVPSSSSNIPVKQKCQETSTCSITLTVTVNQKHSNEAGCETLLTLNRHSANRLSANVVSDFIENRSSIVSVSNLENVEDSSDCDVESIENLDIAACDIEGTENLDDSAICDVESMDGLDDSATCDTEDKNSTAQISQQQFGHVHARTPKLAAKSKVSDVHLDRPVCFQSETRIDYLPHVDVQQITLSVTTSRDSTPVTNICRPTSRKQGTPIMTRAALRVIQNNILESSF